MAVIELSAVQFYRGGVADAGTYVGNGWENGAIVRRVARYTITPPAEGAQAVSFTFRTAGKVDGDYHIPIRFFIGEDPDSHVNAGPDSGYTGELTQGEDWVTFTGAVEMMLLPGKIYYLWLFPGVDTYSYYSWIREGYTSTMETEGSACVVPILRSGAWWLGLIYCTYKGNWWLCAGYMCRGGTWYLCGAT